MMPRIIRPIFSLLVLSLTMLLTSLPAQAHASIATATMSSVTNPVSLILLIDISSNMIDVDFGEIRAMQGAPIFALLLIGAGLIFFVFFVGLMAYVFFFYYRKQQPQPSRAAPSASAPLPAVVDDRPVIDQTWKGEAPDLKAKLQVVDGHKFMSRPMFDLDKSEMKIGRNTEIDIHIKDGGVSRVHAKITYRDNGFFIQDLASTAGTEIDGSKISAHEDVRLQNQTEIKIGDVVKFRFETIDVDPDKTMFDDGIKLDLDKTIFDDGVDFDLDKTIVDPDIPLPKKPSNIDDPRMTLDVSWDEIVGNGDNSKTNRQNDQ